MLLLAGTLPVGAALQWKRGELRTSAPYLLSVVCLSITLGFLVGYFQDFGKLFAPIGVTLAAWVILSTIFEFGFKIKIFKTNFKQTLYRIGSTKRSLYGKYFGHIGFGLMIFGISTVTAWELEDIRVVKLRSKYTIGNYEFELLKVEDQQVENFWSRKAFIAVNISKNKTLILTPEKRFYPIQSVRTTEAAISTNIFRDVYLVLGDKKSADSWVVKTYIKPFIIWIWLGAIIIALGGLLSLTDRRALRIKTKDSLVIKKSVQ